MKFQEAQEKILGIFKKNNFTQLVLQNKHHSVRECIHSCQNDSQIIITFPGYKAVVDKKVTYDYRVDLKRKGYDETALSHANIVIDIYNKVVNCGMSKTALRDTLINITREGTHYRNEIRDKLHYTPSAPTQELLDLAQSAHNGKYFNRSGNLLDLEIEELLASIKWIMLQEDLNYPISKGFLGRKMPLSRYLETLFIIDDNEHSLQEVIQRTISHSRPKQWDKMDYSFLELIE